MSCDGLWIWSDGPGGCHVMDLGLVRRMSCDGFGLVGQGDVM